MAKDKEKKKDKKGNSSSIIDNTARRTCDREEAEERAAEREAEVSLSRLGLVNDHLSFNRSSQQMDYVPAIVLDCVCTSLAE